MSLQGKVALVTGASRGIGKAIALELARLGATVHGTARKADTVAAVAQEAANAALTGKIIPHALDVTDQPALIALIDTLAEDKAAGGLGILVNNAGITADNLMMAMSDEEFDSVINTNLRAVFVASRAAVRHMIRARWGRIINISSIAGVMGNAGQANYAASKAGVIAMSKSLAKEVGKRKVTVNVVAPGFITTDMTAVLSEEIKKGVTQLVPLQRMGEPQEIASVVGFLAGESSSYLTGQVLCVDGGLHM